MTDLRITTTGGTDAILEDAVVQELRANLHGPVLCPDDAGYDETRKVWNGMIDRRPALIASCAGAADVIAVVKFARAHEALVSVRGGGHNIPGNAVCEGGLMIDLARMRSVRVDPVRRTARAEGGATWEDFDRETQAFGLATTGARFLTLELPASLWAGASAGSAASTAFPATTCSQPISSRRMVRC